MKAGGQRLKRKRLMRIPGGLETVVSSRAFIRRTPASFYSPKLTMKTSCLTILILASLIWKTHGGESQPLYIHTNGINIVVRSPFSSTTNRPTRQATRNTSARPMRLNTTNRLASPAVSVRSAPQVDLRQMKRGLTAPARTSASTKSALPATWPSRVRLSSPRPTIIH